MDANGSTIDGSLRKMLEEEGVDVEEFSHKYYVNTPPHTFIDCKILIDAGYRIPDAEITASFMLSFLDSTCDHRIWLLEVTARSMLGCELLKIAKPPGRRLVSTQPRSVKTYNEIVEKQFLLHRKPEKIDAVDKLFRICGTPTPPRLKSTMIKLYQQMNEIRVHTEKKCRKFLTAGLSVRNTHTKN